MKKILLVTIFSILLTPLYAGPNDKVTKSGFISKKNIHPVKNDLPPSIGTHSYSSIPLKRKLRRRYY